MMIRMIAVGIADNDFAIRGCGAATCDLFVACAGVVLSDANSFVAGGPDDPSGFHDVTCSSFAAGVSPRPIAGDSICSTPGLPPATLPTAASIPGATTTKAVGFGVEKLR